MGDRTESSFLGSIYITCDLCLHSGAYMDIPAAWKWSYWSDTIGLFQSSHFHRTWARHNEPGFVLLRQCFISIVLQPPPKQSNHESTSPLVVDGSGEYNNMSRDRISFQMTLNVVDWENMSLPAPSGLAWDQSHDTQTLLSLNKGDRSQQDSVVKWTSSFLSTCCCHPLLIITTIPVMNRWPSRRSFTWVQGTDKGSLTQVKRDIPTDQE